jgi:hypothetical protein
LRFWKNGECIAVTGRLELNLGGKYRNQDNFIVHPDHRSKGLGKMLTILMSKPERKKLIPWQYRCFYTGKLYTVHRFYYNQGFESLKAFILGKYWTKRGYLKPTLSYGSFSKEHFFITLSILCQFCGSNHQSVWLYTRNSGGLLWNKLRQSRMKKRLVAFIESVRAAFEEIRLQYFRSFKC